MEDWVTTREAAEILGITDSRVRQMIIEKVLPAQKFGHINMLKKSDVELARNRTAVGRPKKEKD